MEEQDVGYVCWSRWGLELFMAGGKLRRIIFAAKGRSEEARKPKMAAACHQLREYLKGSGKGFTLELDPEGTKFQKEVWAALQEIPYGETRSYKQIAERIGRPRAYRAVGQAANKNPLPIVIPCHRLVGSNGSLGGYAGGLEFKKSLLELEQKTMEQG